jgi:hypothetical protein
MKTAQQRLSTIELFYAQMRRQNIQWELYDKKIIEEEKAVKPLRPIRNKKK